MAKPVKIKSISATFDTQKAAKEHFQAIKDRHDIGASLVGDDLVHVKGLYEQYCEVTDWPLPAGISGFSVDNKIEEVSPGEFRTQKCFWYHLTDGTKHDFSVPTAIEKISRKQNS